MLFLVECFFVILGLCFVQLTSNYWVVRPVLNCKSSSHLYYSVLPRLPLVPTFSHDSCTKSLTFSRFHGQKNLRNHQRVHNGILLSACLPSIEAQLDPAAFLFFCFLFGFFFLFFPFSLSLQMCSCCDRRVSVSALRAGI